MSKLIRHQPCDELSHNLGLVIYSLDGDENLWGADKLNYGTEYKEAKAYQYIPYFLFMLKK